MRPARREQHRTSPIKTQTDDISFGLHPTFSTVRRQSLISTDKLFRGTLLLAPLLLSMGCRRNGFPDVPAGYREFAYVANAGGNTVTILDLVYLRPDRTLAVGASPVALTPNPKRAEIYVLNSSPDSAAGSVSVIDTSRNAVVATIPTGRNPVSLSVGPAGKRAYVANAASDSITVIDLDARRAIATVSTGSRPESALVAPDGRSLVVANRRAGTITVYSVAMTGPPLTLRATFPGCPGATAPVILPDSSKAFVACSASHQVMALSLAAAPDSFAARQDSSLLTDRLIALLDVGDGPGYLTLKPDGGEIFVSNLASNTISEISTQTNEVGSTYPIGDRPAHGIVSADNGTLWVSNSGADSLGLYSIDDGRLVSSIRTGNSPDALAFSADEHLLLAADTKSGDVAVIRTASRLGPSLFTMLPAGNNPVAIAVKASQAKQ